MGSTGRLCEEDGIETALKGIGGGGEPCIKRQIIPDCGCKVAEGSFAKFSREPTNDYFAYVYERLTDNSNTSWV